MILIQLDNIQKSFQEQTVLKDFSLSITRGDRLIITGPSGVGKSTLLNIIGLLDLPDKGHYHLLGKDLHALPFDQKNALRIKHFGYVFQDALLVPDWTVKENILLASRYHQQSHDPSHLAFLVDKLDLGPLLGKNAHYLSGGQKQRASIARALLMQPDIIIADEPTASLDSTNANIIKTLMTSLCQELNQTLILATHDVTWLSKASLHIDLTKDKT